MLMVTCWVNSEQGYDINPISVATENCFNYKILH